MEVFALFLFALLSKVLRPFSKMVEAQLDLKREASAATEKKGLILNPDLSNQSKRSAD